MTSFTKALQVLGATAALLWATDRQAEPSEAAEGTQ